MKTAAAMEPGRWQRLRGGGGGRYAHQLAAPGVPPRVQPLIGPAPRSTMFFPLVVLVAVLPGLIALNTWDLTPPGPLWGLRALAVVDGLALDQVPAAEAIRPVAESARLRAVSFQPPLYAWLAALGMRLSADLDPLASVLPSYVAGSLAVMLTYLHGRIWRGGGMGLAAALLIGFNPRLLLRMQEATPDTLGLAGAMGALLCYACHERTLGGSSPRWIWAGPLFWAAAGGLALGLSLMSVGGFGLIVLPVAALHQYYLAANSAPLPRPPARAGRRWMRWWGRPAVRHGLLALGVALAVALPWHLRMVQDHGWDAANVLAFQPRGSSGPWTSLLARLIDLAPVTLPLGLFGAVRAIRLALADEDNSPPTVGASLWVIWLALAALAPAIWPTGPLAVMELFLLIPLNLLAALTVADLVNRRLSVRVLIGLAPATAMSLAWWISEDLRTSVLNLFQGRASTSDALGLHLAVDVVLASLWLTVRLEGWAHGRDDRQRLVLAVFLLAVLAITSLTGIQEVMFRHNETHDLLTLRTMILRRNRERPFETLAVVGPEAGRRLTSSTIPRGLGQAQYSGGWLRFILRTALPHLPQRDVATIDELLSLPQGQRLIILTGTTQGLSSPVKSRLGLEAIHPGRPGILYAYATAHRQPARH